MLTLAGRCAEAAPTLAIDYTLFADVDPQHRGLLNLVEGGASRSHVLGARGAQRVVGGAAGGALGQLVAYVHEGVWHIWLGFDHILFLVSLLLPAVLVRRDRAWQPAASFRASFVEVAKVVTAFTAAHSITLTLAALGVVALPSRLVESAIALSVVLAALNNVAPVVQQRPLDRGVRLRAAARLRVRGRAAGPRTAAPTALALSLAGFNLGVELGQLAIVAAFLPVAYALRAHAGLPPRRARRRVAGDRRGRGGVARGARARRPAVRRARGRFEPLRGRRRD